MSRMTKFLKQTCTFERAKRDSRGNVQLDKFGEVIYESPRQLRCRRERVMCRPIPVLCSEAQQDTLPTRASR